jgi:lipoprotein-anchoring transpeptidase ErfK/SrfK
MKFGADIRSLRSIFALALALLAPAAVLATQQTIQVEPSRTQPEQNKDTVAASPLVPVPATQTSPLEQTSSTPSPSKPAPTKPTPKQRKKGAVDALKPGQFVWVTQAVYEGPMKIVIVLDIQRIYVFQNDKLIGFSTISSGKKGKETPTGFFNILQKNVDHKSNLYSDAPMPFMQRLTWDGIAMHGGYLPGYPASHGCIRLPLPFAKALFGVTRINQEVFVLQDTSTPVKRPEPKPVVDPTLAPTVPPVETTSTQEAPVSKAIDNYPPAPSA